MHALLTEFSRKPVFLISHLVPVKVSRFLPVMVYPSSNICYWLHTYSQVSILSIIFSTSMLSPSIMYNSILSSGVVTGNPFRHTSKFKLIHVGYNYFDAVEWMRLFPGLSIPYLDITLSIYNLSGIIFIMLVALSFLFCAGWLLLT